MRFYFESIPVDHETAKLLFDDLTAEFLTVALEYFLTVVCVPPPSPEVEITKKVTVY